MKCPNYKCCGIVTRRDQIDNHYQTCWASNCKHRDHHEIGKCPLQIIECPNNGCNVKMRRGDMLRYHQNDCQFNNNNNNNNDNGNSMDLCTPKKSNNGMNNGSLTEEQIERIRQNREKALQRRNQWRLSQSVQHDSFTQSPQSQQANNYDNNNNDRNKNVLSEDVKRRIEQNRQKALARRRAYQMRLANGSMSQI